jgi:hypothetical protein
VTGAGFGIGALAIELARSGAKLTISDVDLDALAATEQPVRTIGATVKSDRVDVSGGVSPVDTSRNWFWSRVGGLSGPRLYVVPSNVFGSRLRATEFGEDDAGPAHGVWRFVESNGSAAVCSPRPGALQQIAQLGHARGGRGNQSRCAARSLRTIQR